MSHHLNEELEEKLRASVRDIRDIKEDIHTLLDIIQDELVGLREREFWREYRETYQQE